MAEMIIGRWRVHGAMLGERIGPDRIVAHHGSLSRRTRLAAEEKLKSVLAEQLKQQGTELRKKAAEYELSLAATEAGA